MNENSDLFNFRKKPGRPNTVPDNETLKKLYAYHTVSEIAEMYETSTETVRHWIKRARKEGMDIPRKKSGRPKKRLDDSILKALYKTKTAAEMAATLDTTPGTVRSWIAAIRKKDREADTLRNNDKEKSCGSVNK